MMESMVQKREWCRFISKEGNKLSPVRSEERKKEVVRRQNVFGEVEQVFRWKRIIKRTVKRGK